MQAPLEVCGLPHAVPNGLHLGERATLFDLTLALGMAGDVGRSREEAEAIRNKKLGIANFRPLAPAVRRAVAKRGLRIRWPQPPNLPNRRRLRGTNPSARYCAPKAKSIRRIS